ncbi:hypothetical protein ATY75_03280 [Rhizobium sp. N122]|uniref:hypothetical protein n=1 Tax=Rhizobium sp. N122 TaxID=1764272 RepID=UPI000B5A9949|nr:hypothetical protein [Rhizobium sp. N122]OWV87346.1 hypothetical protein ATY75_03280 [Rhizobium sp. N122]
MNALEIAKFLLDEAAKKTGRKGTTQDINDIIARIIAAEFPDTSPDLLRESMRIVNDVLSKDELFKLRKIDPVNITGLDIDTPENGEPICERVNPAALYVDPAYQRQIGARGLRQIRKIVEAWDWNKFKPPICAYAEHDGVTVLKVLDGQHTAIAAASHPEIDFIPIMIVEASATSQQAAAFVGQNTERLQVTALQLHQSALVAHDLDAMTIDMICQQAGVTILRHPGAGGATKPGQTVAINAIAALINKRGNVQSRAILEVLAQAGFAPILKDQIKAVELLLTSEEYCTILKTDDLVAAIRGTWIADLDAAKQMALAQKWPLWRSLAIVWNRKCKKSRPTSIKAMRAA